MKHGFSLVELSIVLVILGLLTGGILGGQSLMRAAELRSISKEYQTFSIAVNTFKDKYFAIPGDMINAEQFWGTMSTGTCPGATGGVGTETCSGNGLNDIDNASNEDEAGENFTFWQHLANAGLIEGSYTGIAGSGSRLDAIAGINVPGSKMTSAGWIVNTVGAGGSGTMYAVEHGNHFVFGAKRNNFGMSDPALTPEEAWNIDIKSDDGLPASGSITARYWDDLCSSANDGVSANNDLDASYRLSDDSVQCALHFTNAF